MLLSTIEEHVQEYEFKTPPLKPPVSAVISSYIIIDAMAIVNKIQIEKSHNKISNVQCNSLRIILLNKWRVQARSAGVRQI